MREVQTPHTSKYWGEAHSDNASQEKPARLILPLFSHSVRLKQYRGSPRLFLSSVTNVHALDLSVDGTKGVVGSQGGRWLTELAQTTGIKARDGRTNGE